MEEAIVYKNIIFDFGGVLFNISYEDTIAAFSQLIGRDFSRIYSAAGQSEIFDKLDKGEITPADFYHELRELTAKPNMTDEDIETAWNEMLLDLPSDRIPLLQALRKNGYKLYLLSNTNIIHMTAIKSYLQSKYKMDFFSLFDKTYLSYEIGMRKPERAVFQHVISDTGINPAETLYIDDIASNMKNAAREGLNTVIYEPYSSLRTVLMRYGIKYD